MRSKKLVFMHLQKCGGTSFHKLLEQHFSQEEICPRRLKGLSCYGKKSNLQNYKLYSGHFVKDDIDCIEGDKDVVTMFREPKARILSNYYYWKSYKINLAEGHPFGGLIAAKTNSLQDFLNCENMDILQYIDNYYVRSMIGQLYIGPKREFLYPEDESVDIAKETIDKFTAIGIMENYKLSVNNIFSALGLDTVAHIPHENSNKYPSDRNNPDFESCAVVRYEINKEIEGELNRLTRLDQIIYQYAKNKFQSFSTC